MDQNYYKVNMSNSPDPVKQNIIDWCNTDNIQCNDLSNDNPIFSWIVGMGKNLILIYKVPQFPDRIYIESRIKISENHQKLINETWNKAKKNNMLLTLKAVAVQLDFNISFTFEENDKKPKVKDKITEIKSNKVHFHSSIKKADFLSVFNRISNIHNHLLNQLSILLETEVKQLEEKQKLSESDNPLSG